MEKRTEFFHENFVRILLENVENVFVAVVGDVDDENAESCST